MTAQDVLKNSIVEGTIVKLPPTHLDRKLYQEVAKSLELIGGKWKGGKVMGFVFPSDPSDLLEQISAGEKRNIKKEFQFFATPTDLADWLVRLAEIKDGRQVILEPSAGHGAIIEAIYKAFPYYMRGPNDKPGVTVDYYELMEVNRMVLSKKITSNERWSSSTSCMGTDFLKAKETIKYDRIIANPPFSKNSDITHIQKMYDLLKPGGRLVSVASLHWIESKNKKETAFREWLEKQQYHMYDIESGTFKQSGTFIASVVLVIDKK